MTKPIKLSTPDEVEAAREMDLTNKQFNKLLTAMQQRHTKELEDTMTEYRKIMRDLFLRATKNHLSDPYEAFTKNSHYVNYAFLEHGDVYLCEVNPTDEGASAADSEPEEHNPPRKIILN